MQQTINTEVRKAHCEGGRGYVWNGFVWLGIGINGAVFEHYFHTGGVYIDRSSISLSRSTLLHGVSHLVTN
jgi:hypothetical protein